MDFNFDNQRPIYIQLVHKLRFSIVTGVYPAGSKIPSVRELALTAKVNPNTMQKALATLENEKLIYTERTNGKYVTEDKALLEKTKKEFAKNIVKTYITDMNNLGITYDEAIIYLQELGGD